MCKTIRFRKGEESSLEKIKASYEGQMKIEAARKKAAKAKNGKQAYAAKQPGEDDQLDEEKKVTFSTDELGDITGVVMTLEKHDCAHMMRFLVEQIGGKEVPGVKLWTVFYIDAAEDGIIYCENKAQGV